MGTKELTLHVVEFEGWVSGFGLLSLMGTKERTLHEPCLGKRTALSAGSRALPVGDRRTDLPSR
jgi:hypothetical protein